MGAQDFHKSPSQIIKNIYNHLKKNVRILITGPSVAGLTDDTEVTTSTVAGNKNAIDVYLRDFSGKSSFGEFLTAQTVPRLQIDAVYGLRTVTDHQVIEVGSATSSVADAITGKEFCCDSGTISGDAATIRSIRAIKYRPGQGAQLRFTARFSAPQVNNSQRAGGMNEGNELTFGYDTAQNFGILHRRGGRQEIRTLTITVAASGAETATITLNGVTFTPALTAGTINHNAYELGAATYAGWDVYHVGDTVIFISTTTGVKNGTYSFASTGTAAGTFAQTGAGAENVDHWIPQTAWNKTKLLTADDPFILDPSKGNVFQIQFQYLGYGGIKFFIEDPVTADYICVHSISFANANVGPSLDNPSLKVGWISENVDGAPVSAVQVYGASGSAFVEGTVAPIRNLDGHVVSALGIGATLTSVMNIRVMKVYNGYINLQEILPKLVSAAVDGTKSTIIQVLINPDLSGEPDWGTHNTFGLVELDVTALTVTVNGATQEVANVGLAKVGHEVIPLSDLDVRLQPGDILTIAAQSLGSTDIVASASWNED